MKKIHNVFLKFKSENLKLETSDINHESSIKHKTCYYLPVNLQLLKLIQFRSIIPYDSCIPDTSKQTNLFQQKCVTEFHGYKLFTHTYIVNILLINKVNKEHLKSQK